MKDFIVSRYVANEFHSSITSTIIATPFAVLWYGMLIHLEKRNADA